MKNFKEFSESQKESLLFYVTNDYLLINSFLYGDINKAFKGALIANEDAKAVMAEAREMGFGKRWGVSEKEGEEIYKMYENRIFDELNPSTQQKLLKRIKNDIKNIEDCMIPNEEMLTLYRNVLEKNLPKNLCEGQVLELKGFSSTSLEIHKDSFRHDPNIVRFVIQVPKKLLLLKLSDFPEIANEKDEVILHPLKCKIENIIEKTENSPKLFEVSAYEMIDIQSNIKNSIKLNNNKNFIL